MTLRKEKSSEKLLCIRLSGLGDVVHALNALSLLRKHRPTAHIAWVVEDRFSSLLMGHPHIDELIVLPRTIWSRKLAYPTGWCAVLRDAAQLARRLRKEEFAVSIDFQSSIKSAWLVAAGGAPTRVGFGWGVAREFSPLFNNTLVRLKAKDCHRIERNLALLAPLGIPTRYEEPVLVCGDHDAHVIDAALAKMHNGGPLVIIHPGTSEFAAFKRWSTEGYAQVADRLVAELGAQVLISRGPGEENIARRVLNAMTQKGALAPRTENLQQLVRLLSHADLFIGSDSGPLHLASALKVPAVALFGPKDPATTGPYCGRSIVVTGTAPCRPCRRRRCPNPVCMSTIRVHDVFTAARLLLDGGGQCRAKAGPIRNGAFFDFKPGGLTGPNSSPIVHVTSE